MTGQPAEAMGLAPGRGIACQILAVLLFVVMDGMVKDLVTKGYSPWQVLFCRAAFSLPAILVLARLDGGLGRLKTRRPAAHLGRCLLGIVSLICFFWSLKFLPLADVVAISFSAPLMITALSQPVLGERVGPHRWAAVIVGFVGVLVIVRPGAATIEPAALLVLGSVVMYALAVVLIRNMSATEAPTAIVFYFSLFATLITACVQPFVWAEPASAGDLGLMAAIGVLGTGAQFFMVLAYRYAPVAVAAPFEYTAMIWAIMIGIGFFGEWPTAIVLAGAAMVAASGLYIARRETRTAS